ncbi:hypothetical protein LOK49_LG08G01077 [Camellia lanceoleosa]|uniref:Uncharacterized protein n=1 Tax=Camellia lanceoleosa TaxID=1840588 RepID=A0ACC0GW24_9ERIC|nr:hypothetical protein LOK49_LG08G01077 [Camellia lanceoleosa]
MPNDPGIHEDFRPTNKLESSGLSLKDIVEQDVKDNLVMLYMKGVPDLPQCGFSSPAVRVLKEYDVPLSARNILEDSVLKNAVKAYSHGNGAFCQDCHHCDHDVSHHDRDVLHSDNHHGHHVRDHCDYVDE